MSTIISEKSDFLESNEADENFRYVLVGNIIDKYYFGEEKIIKSGTKEFRAGAKVYLFPKYGGMGHERIPVYGLPRKKWKKIMIVIRACLIKNVRVMKTYDKKIIELVDRNFDYKCIQYECSLEIFADNLNSVGTIEITE